MIYEIFDDSGNVINRILASEEFVQEHYPNHYRLIEQQEIISEPNIITKVSFRFRMTDAEYVGILTAAKTDIEVAAWVETFNMVTQINLDDQRTKDGVAKLVSKDLLTQDRATEILTNPVQPNERP